MADLPQLLTVPEEALAGRAGRGGAGRPGRRSDGFQDGRRAGGRGRRSRRTTASDEALFTAMLGLSGQLRRVLVEALGHGGDELDHLFQPDSSTACACNQLTRAEDVLPLQDAAQLGSEPVYLSTILQSQDSAAACR